MLIVTRKLMVNTGWLVYYYLLLLLIIIIIIIIIISLDFDLNISYINSFSKIPTLFT